MSLGVKVTIACAFIYMSDNGRSWFIRLECVYNFVCKEDKFNFMFIVFVKIADTVTNNDNDFIKMYWIDKRFI